MSRMLPRAFSRIVLALLAAVMITAATPAPVAAAPQEAVQVEPPRPRRADKPPILWSYLAVILILVAVFGANTIPSKRGHQD